MKFEWGNCNIISKADETRRFLTSYVCESYTYLSVCSISSPVKTVKKKQTEMYAATFIQRSCSRSGGGGGGSGRHVLPAYYLKFVIILHSTVLPTVFDPGTAPLHLSLQECIPKCHILLQNYYQNICIFAFKYLKQIRQQLIQQESNAHYPKSIHIIKS